MKYRYIHRYCLHESVQSTYSQTMYDTFDAETQALYVPLEIPADLQTGPVVPITALTLTVRTRNCLQSAGIWTVLQLQSTPYAQLRQLPNIGRKSLVEIRRALDELRPYVAMSRGERIYADDIRESKEAPR